MKRLIPLIPFVGMLVFTSVAVSQHLTSAKLYLKYKQYDQAEASALKAVEKDPKDEEAWFVLGQAQYELKKYQEMVQSFDKAAALDPEEHKSEIHNYRLKVWADSFNEGIKFYNRGRDSAEFFVDAIHAFKNAIAAMPDSLRTYYVCALALYGNKQTNDAIAMLNAALKKDPKQLDELRLLSKLYSQVAREKAEAKDSAGAKQSYLMAIETLEKLHQADSTNTDDIMSLIDLYERQGMSQKSQDLVKGAIASNPNNLAFRYIYGVYFIRQEKYPEGIEQLLKVDEAGPDTTSELYFDAVYNLGVAYLNWGVAMKKVADDQAEAALKNKTKNFKEDTSYKEKFKAAIPYFEKATQVKPDDLGVWQQLGKLYANLNMSEKAKAAFEKVDKLMK